MSLRARLLVALLALTTVGLVTLAAVTYAEQRSFLLERADQQAQAALRAVSFQLAGASGVPPLTPGGGRPPFPPPPRDGDGPGEDGGSGPQGLERGTYGQLRDASGSVIARTAVTSY